MGTLHFAPRSTLAIGAVLWASLAVADAAARTGGPDAFGYEFIDSDEVGGPLFDYEDITLLGVPATLSDDDASWEPIGFDFTFYGETYDSFAFGANGGIAFYNSAMYVSNSCLPSNYMSVPFVAAMWDDLYPPMGGEFLYVTLGQEPFRRTLVQWLGVPHISGGGAYDFQIVLHETLDEIVLLYNDVSSGNASYNYGQSATVGIQGDTSNYLEYGCNQPALADGLAVRFGTCLAGADDADGDGFDACIDCDDTDATVYPGAEDVCEDGVDADCAGDLESTELDDDGDGWSECAGDCDDTDATVHPDGAEACDGMDNDCDGDVDEDGDGDHWSLCAGDCDDTDPDRFPGNPEVCDEIDNDCDDEVDEDIDWDLDGVAGCGGEDCDDTDPNTYPGAPEVAGNGIDEDCDGSDLPGAGDDDDDDASGDDDDDDDDDGGGCDHGGATSPDGAAPALSLLLLTALVARRRGGKPHAR